MQRFFLLLLVGALGCVGSQRTPKQPFRVAFYNVENLFDTTDDPDNPRDEEFTPGSKKAWTPERYQSKLNSLERVVDELGSPVLLGLSEVENARVLEDLTNEKALRKAGYAFVHYDSPDYRGIDNALLYRRRHFTVLASDHYEVRLPKSVSKYATTRDILYVRGVVGKTDTLHLFVNHWPSRIGGLEASEGKRVYVAEQLRGYVDGILQKNARANVIVMGDFNDETDNRSIRETLGAQPIDLELASGQRLYNAHASLDEVGIGTYNFRGTWNFLDQVIVSGALVNGAGGLEYTSAGVFKRDWLLFEHPERGPTPNRTYGGPNYYGGVSDHLPVFVELRRAGR